MPAISRFRPFTLMLVAAIASQAALAAAAAAPAARAYDPWAAVPAWPAACYSSQDKFSDQVFAARESVGAESKRQDEINKNITAQSGPGGAEDPMELARRVQEAMMKDPQHAAEQFQSMGAADPAATQQRAMAAHTRYEEVKAGDKRFTADYQAARKAMLEPARTRMRALDKKVAPFVVRTAEGSQYPEWADKEAVAIMPGANQAYVAFCAQWFGAGGKVPAYLRQRKDFLVREHIPAMVKAIDDPAVSGQQLVGHSTQGYHSVAPHHAVEDFLVLSYDLFGLRNERAFTCKLYTDCRGELGL